MHAMQYNGMYLNGIECNGMQWNAVKWNTIPRNAIQNPQLIMFVIQEAYHELYWSVGDGGPQNDPDNRAQDLTTLHGSIVRISVPSAVAGTGYDIPVGNFVGVNGE